MGKKWQLENCVVKMPAKLCVAKGFKIGLQKREREIFSYLDIRGRQSLVKKKRK